MEELFLILYEREEFFLVRISVLAQVQLGLRIWELGLELDIITLICVSSPSWWSC